MGFFVLWEAGRSADATGRFAGAAAKSGFTKTRQFELGKLRLMLFGNQTGNEPACFEQQNGDFIAVLGSLIYRGTRSPDCLPDLLDRFEPDSHDWRGFIGTHVVLIRKGGVVRIFGDGLGACKIYSDQRGGVWSSSFLAMCEITAPSAFDVQACYEYVINGTVSGHRSLIEGISCLPANTVLSVTDNAIGLDQRPSPIINRDLFERLTLDQAAEYHCRQLDAVFGPIAENFGDRIRLSFSGGFDSRLMLAMLIKHGARPTLFVYGNQDDEDVQIARLITDAEGLPLEHIDKSRVPACDPDAFIGETEKNLFAFDGWKVETPLFDFGADRCDRAKRHLDGQVPLNGSLGEIYRNFFYMPDGRSSTGAVISTFYSRYDRKAFTDRFQEDEYRSALATAMREAIGSQSDRLARSQVEELYPKFRGRFWSGRDAQLNQHFGPMFFPYLEHVAVSNTPKIPIRFKDLGYLQGRMIGLVNARIAGYPSDYGFPLDGPRPLKYRLKTFLGTQRPPFLRKHSFSLTHRTKEKRDGPLSAAYLSNVIDMEFPIMRSLFKLDAINSASQYGIIATLEYLGERYNLRVPGD